LFLLLLDHARPAGIGGGLPRCRIAVESHRRQQRKEQGRSNVRFHRLGSCSLACDYLVFR